MSKKMLLSVSRMTALSVFFAYFLSLPYGAVAASSQPIVWSQECPTGGEYAEQLYQQAVDYQKARNGIAGDATKAAEFFEAAIREGNAKATLAYGLMLRQSALSPAEMGRIYLSEDLYKLGMAMQCPEAGHMLAEAYEDFFYGGGSKRRIIALYREAAEKGSLVSMVARAQIDEDDAVYWLTKALDGGYGYAGSLLADIYFIDQHNTEKGLDILRKGASLGSTDCLFSLWMIYYYGKYGQEKDSAYAEKIYALWDAIDEKYEPKSIPDFDTLIPLKPVLPYAEYTEEE